MLFSSSSGSSSTTREDSDSVNPNREFNIDSTGETGKFHNFTKRISHSTESSTNNNSSNCRVLTPVVVCGSPCILPQKSMQNNNAAAPTTHDNKHNNQMLYCSPASVCSSISVKASSTTLSNNNTSCNSSNAVPASESEKLTVLNHYVIDELKAPRPQAADIESIVCPASVKQFRKAWWTGVRPTTCERTCRHRSKVCDAILLCNDCTGYYCKWLADLVGIPVLKASGRVDPLIFHKDPLAKLYWEKISKVVCCPKSTTKCLMCIRRYQLFTHFLPGNLLFRGLVHQSAMKLHEEGFSVDMGLIRKVTRRHLERIAESMELKLPPEYMSSLQAYDIIVHRGPLTEVLARTTVNHASTITAPSSSSLHVASRSASQKSRNQTIFKSQLTQNNNGNEILTADDINKVVTTSTATSAHNTMEDLFKPSLTSTNTFPAASDESPVFDKRNGESLTKSYDHTNALVALELLSRLATHETLNSTSFCLSSNCITTEKECQQKQSAADESILDSIKGNEQTCKTGAAETEEHLNENRYIKIETIGVESQEDDKEDDDTVFRDRITSQQKFPRRVKNYDFKRSNSKIAFDRDDENDSPLNTEVNLATSQIEYGVSSFIIDDKNTIRRKQLRRNTNRRDLTDCDLDSNSKNSPESPLTNATTNHQSANIAEALVRISSFSNTAEFLTSLLDNLQIYMSCKKKNNGLSGFESDLFQSKKELQNNNYERHNTTSCPPTKRRRMDWGNLQRIIQGICFNEEQQQQSPQTWKDPTVLSSVRTENGHEEPCDALKSFADVSNSDLLEKLIILTNAGTAGNNKITNNSYNSDSVSLSATKGELFEKHSHLLTNSSLSNNGTDLSMTDETAHLDQLSEEQRLANGGVRGVFWEPIKEAWCVLLPLSSQGSPISLIKRRFLSFPARQWGSLASAKWAAVYERIKHNFVELKLIDKSVQDEFLIWLKKNAQLISLESLHVHPELSDLIGNQHDEVSTIKSSLDSNSNVNDEAGTAEEVNDLDNNEEESSYGVSVDEDVGKLLDDCGLNKLENDVVHHVNEGSHCSPRLLDLLKSLASTLAVQADENHDNSNDQNMSSSSNNNNNNNNQAKPCKMTLDFDMNKKDCEEDHQSISKLNSDIDNFSVFGNNDNNSTDLLPNVAAGLLVSLRLGMST